MADVHDKVKRVAAETATEMSATDFLEIAGRVRRTPDGDGYIVPMEVFVHDDDVAVGTSPITAGMIREAFEASDHHRGERYSVDFEHGSWFVTELDSGRTRAVVECEREDGSAYLDFELVAEFEVE